MGYGIDVGTTSLKAVALRRTFSGWKATGASRKRTSRGLPPAEAKPLLLRALLESLGPRRGARPGVVGLSGRDINLQLLQQPAMKPANYRVMMGYELDQRKGEATDLYIDYCTLREPDGFYPQYLALIGIGKSAYIDDRVDLAVRGGVDVRDAVPNPFALFAAYKNAYETDGTTILLLDLGSDNMDLAFVRGGKLVFARNVGQGARVFDQQIAGMLGSEVEAAEAVKVAKGTLLPPEGEESEEQETVRAGVRSAAGQLVGFINSALNHARMQLNDKELSIDRVLLSGGGARLKGLPDYLAGALKVPVEPLDPFRKVDLSALSPEVRDDLAQLPTDMAVATGLAQLESPSSDIAPSVLSILPAKLKQRRNFLRTTLWTGVAGAVMLAVLLVQTGLLLMRKSVQESKLQDFMAKTTDVRKRIQEMGDLEREQREAAGKADLLTGYLSGGRMPLDAVSRLRRSLPPEVRLKDVRVAEDGRRRGDREGSSSSSERHRAAFTVRRRGLVTGEVENETDQEIRLKGHPEPYKDEDVVDGIRGGVLRWSSSARVVVLGGEIDESIRGGARDALNAIRDQLADGSRGIKATIQSQRASDKAGWRQFEIVVASE
jgi:type IV pilus assembly protein PilM